MRHEYRLGKNKCGDNEFAQALCEFEEFLAPRIAEAERGDCLAISPSEMFKEVKRAYPVLRN